MVSLTLIMQDAWIDSLFGIALNYFYEQGGPNEDRAGPNYIYIIPRCVIILAS